jgi:hypothetical protein
MAGENDHHSERAQEGWNAFCRFLGLSTAAVVIVLALMAIFLL